MKLEIRKTQSKGKRKRVLFRLKHDQVQAMKSLDGWLSKNREFNGSLLWEQHLAERIEAEICTRQNANDNEFINFKMSLPRDLLLEMAESDTEYAEKGYPCDWDSRVRVFLDAIIKNYIKQLKNIFGQSPPPELIKYHKKSREVISTISPGDNKIISGAPHEIG